MRTVCDETVKSDLRQRIERLQPTNSAQWGKMNVHQMICHLTDQLRDLDGTRPVKYQGNPVTRHVLRHLLQRMENWPKGVFPSNSDYDQLKGGTKPTGFEADKSELLKLFEALDLTNENKALPVHPAFGKLTHAQYARIVYLHFNHHLKQFGV